MSAPHPPTPASGQPSCDRSAREIALAELACFKRRVLPGALRRASVWHGFDPIRHPEIVEDVEQELALDCLQHADEIAALSSGDRIRRWMRLVQRVDYDLRQRGGRRRRGDVTTSDCATPPPSPFDLQLSAEDAALLGRLAHHAHVLGSGRLSVRSTARALGIGRTRLRKLWQRVAETLGFDSEHVAFWRRRLAEAACMVAAARLVDGGELELWESDRRRGFDPAAFRRRLERIRAALTARPLESGLKRVVEMVAPWKGEGGLSIPPRELLALAESIDPDDPTILQWRFEAELLADDPIEAARCLWRARRVERDRARLALARARLLEARGNIDAARALLVRATGRFGTDPRLLASLRALGGAPRRYATSSAQRPTARTRSNSA